MPRIPTRFWVWAILFVLLAAQAHVWVEPGPPNTSGHSCQVCVAGVWAIVSPSPGFLVTLRAMRLEAEQPQACEKNQQTEASAPRAPPLA